MIAGRAADVGWTWLTAEPARKDTAVAVATVGAASALIAAAPEDFDIGWPEVAAGIGAFIIVLLRRRWPLTLLAISVGWAAVHVVIWDRPSPLLFSTLVLLATAAVRLERGPALVLGGVVGVILYGVALLVSDFGSLGDGRSLIALVWAGAALGLADAVRSWRRYQESAANELRAAVLAADAQTRQQVTEERLAIARELHDLLAHNLSVMNVQTGAALHLLRTDPDQAEVALTSARDAGRAVLDELRELLAVLRDTETDDAPRSALPTLDGIAGLVDTMRSAGLAVTWSEIGARRDLAPAVSLAAYRIVQEALTNAAKHGAGSATLTTRWEPAALAISVTNPAGSLPAGHHAVSSGHGIVGMRERATANGGSLDVRSHDDAFTIQAHLPVVQESAEHRS